MHCLNSAEPNAIWLRAMWLVSSALVTRGDNIRTAELWDLFSVEMPEVQQDQQ